MRYVYRGAEGEIIPREATHITVLAKIIPRQAFYEHPNIVEVICHEDVEKIGSWGFACCPNLRRVIMPGVRIIEDDAFYNCPVLTVVACGTLEIIKRGTFRECRCLRIINLPSVRVVKEFSFGYCEALAGVQFGNKLERIEESAFWDCTALERITIPLKDGIISADNIFQLCEKLRQVGLVEGEVHETISALHFEEWRDDMNREIDSINQILPNAYAGHFNFPEDEDDPECNEGGKALVIRTWIRSVIRKINHYKARHQHVLDEAVLTMQHALPHDILMNNVLPFLELPSYTFEGEDHIIYF